MVTYFEMLGPGRVTLPDGRFHRLKPTRRDQTLAYLAITGDWVTRDRLGFLFWADSSDSTARHNVRQLLKRIRQLGWVERFETDNSAVRWLVENDVAVFRDANVNGRWDGLPDSGHLLVGLERNASLEFEEWLLDQRHQIRAEWQTAVVAAARRSAASGEPDHGLKLLEPLLVEDNGEEVLPIYMELATRAGQRSLAVAAFKRVETRLRNDLGIDVPSEALEIAQRLTHDEAHEPSDLVGARLVGRESELTEISGLLARPNCRLLTLLGTGGIGKSRLAHAVLTQNRDRYVDGGKLVPLDVVSDPNDVLPAIASQINMKLDARLDPIRQLSAFLREKRMLLVLDNVEHLRPAWPQFSQLMDSCPGLEMVVTSRERLRLEGEWVYQVTGLADADAVELFLEAGGRVAPDVTVSADEAAAICRAVGGSPLGIELAVPWLRVMAVDEIISEIENSQHILSGGHLNGLPRHQNMTATMKHSWDLATADEREVAEALSVFTAPYTRELALQVGGADATMLLNLMDKSLIHRRSRNRYSSHPLVRGYASDRLAQDSQRRQEILSRHAAAILQLLSDGTIPLHHKTLKEDVFAAWRHALESQAIDLIAPAVEGLAALVTAEGWIGSGLRALSEAALLGPTPAQRASIKLAESQLLYRQGDYAEAAVSAKDSITAAIEAGDQAGHVSAILSLGWAQKWIAGDEAQYRVTSDALPVAEALGDDSLVTQVLNGLGCSASTLEKCRDHLQVGLARANTTNLRSLISHNLGIVLWALGDAAGGIDHLQRALHLARSEDDHDRAVRSLCTLAFVHGQIGELSTALGLSTEAEALTGGSELLDTRIYLSLVAGEICRLTENFDGAQSRASAAFSMATASDNEAYTLRALRLQGQLLLDRGENELGLGILAFLLIRPRDKGGDFTSEIINPQAWEDATGDVSSQQIEEAQLWARERNLQQVIADAVSASPTLILPSHQTL